ncbi:hypothetical protein BDV25DRAFT_157668 [Aspergillus avenaceus]|uniref:Uncharacterized protein n=1 Tax=Aspergillus avenaceus TaxID=36643 RepID=A0A5N6TQU0_ASPAV|nr:hypothetical protein BDV25DRAFT_157668 [Aspergillus avenaceus]
MIVISGPTPGLVVPCLRVLFCCPFWLVYIDRKSRLAFNHSDISLMWLESLLGSL